MHERYLNLGAARSIRMTYVFTGLSMLHPDIPGNAPDRYMSIGEPEGDPVRHAITDSPALTRPFQRATSSGSIDGSAAFKCNVMFTL